MAHWYYKKQANLTGIRSLVIFSHIIDINGNPENQSLLSFTSQLSDLFLKCLEKEEENLKKSWELGELFSQTIQSNAMMS